MEKGAEYNVQDIIGFARSAWDSIREEAKHIEGSKHTDRMAQLKARPKVIRAEWDLIAPCEDTPLSRAERDLPESV